MKEVQASRVKQVIPTYIPKKPNELPKKYSYECFYRFDSNNNTSYIP